MSMTATAGHAQADPHHIGLVVDHPGPAPKRIVTAYGFWIFLISDIVMFSCFFAAYAVLVSQTADGPKGSEIFEQRNVAIETVCLLLSSFTCGMASIAADERNRLWFYLGMTVTCVLGLIFLAIEFREFADLVARGYGPSRSAFLTAFFSLVGCHGLHVSAGVLWLLTMMAQVFAKGFRADIMRRMYCFALFWHALDIIWVGVFSVVYLLGGGV
ncbi:cytochrome (ubi)quinol oxidase subunit III [Bradyrhizobium commune]|uniref:Cytochrome bo(3) ubiquinol oxidase subunit 3 n=1 Tax=Bradyrhizobium commune TaxID=83627 RepID=A0A7S9GXH9_9BRAD|nr:cytochrome (ubi)quinol oxidase subunit III [Bradyrhizobium commune]QPF89880.1 cytochrome (ubi)quinol oxidase subunit III [Bradyrhizobium commune]